MNDDDKQKLFEKLGFPHDWYNGERRWLSDPAPDAMVTVIDGDYLGTDLDTSETGGLSPELLSMLKTEQCSLVRSERAKAYSAAGLTPEQMMNSWIDGVPTADEMEAKKLEIKALIPWPGEYR